VSKKNKNLIKRDNWFNDYHEIPQLGIKGKRDLNSRIAYYNQDDFKNSTVVDLGCNMGQMTFQAQAWGAKHVTGIEYDSTAVLNANQIKDQLNIDNVTFVVDDLDSNFLWTSMDNFDVVMFLAVIDTIELENRYGILSKACRKTNQVMYFEGHGKQTYNKYMQNIVEYTDFTEIKYMGNTPVSRPFFRCTRERMTSEQAVQAIANSNYDKIAVVGKSFSGKTYIRKHLQQLEHKFTLVDDLLLDPIKGQENTRIDVADLNNIDKFVLFDYRGLEYYPDVDVVFFVTPNGSSIGQSRKPEKPLISPSIKSFANIKEVYTVESR